MDPELQATASLVKTQYTSPPDKFSPAHQTLKSGFTACIIGAGQGIGAYIGYALAHAKVANLVIAARRESDLETAKQQLQTINKDIRVEYHTADVADASSLQRLADFVQDKFGGIDLLVQNAGYSGEVVVDMLKGDPAEVERCFAVNVLGTYYAIRAFVPLLLAKPDGAKTFIAVSTGAVMIRRGEIANLGYCASKMTQLRVVEYLHEQYQGQGISAFAIHPGAVITEMSQGAPESFKKYLVDDISLCGACVVWLLAQGQEAKWLSGRWISAKWDFDELVMQKDSIVEKDLLKLIVSA